MIKKNEKGIFEVEFYDSITFEKGKVVCHMKNIDIILSSTDGLEVTKDNLSRYESVEVYLQVLAVTKKMDFKYAVNCMNTYTLEIGMVANDVNSNFDKYANEFFSSMVHYFTDCSNSEIACYHTVILNFISDEHSITIKVFPDQVVMVDNLNLYNSIEGFVFEQQFFNEFDNSYEVEITDNKNSITSLSS